MLTISALMTWMAIVLSEYFQLKGAEHTVFMSAAAAFIVAFLMEDRRVASGWSLTLASMPIAAGIAVYIGGFGVTPALYVICGVKLFEKLTRAQFWAVILALNVLLLWRLMQTNAPLWGISSFAAYLGFQLFGLMMASSGHALKIANGELLKLNAELISTRALLSESARAQERLSLSRELHDVCGHKLTALKLTLRGGDGLALPAAERALCHTLSDELLSDIRAVVATLREHEGIDLAHALKQLGMGWKRPIVSVQIDAEARAPDVNYATALLRAAQEGLTNAARHGDASTVDIALVCDGDDLLLSVTDNGKGSAKLKRGNGLNGMAERLSALGGSLDVQHLPQGLQLFARLPLHNRVT
jgi:signal transduction histidine kinase